MLSERRLFCMIAPYVFLRPFGGYSFVVFVLDEFFHLGVKKVVAGCVRY